MAAVHAAAVHRRGRGQWCPVSIQVRLNGEPRELPDDATVARAIAELTSASTGIAAAVNGDVVPRGSWTATLLRDGDQVEVVTAVQGG